jgi:hypothetical protein
LAPHELRRELGAKADAASRRVTEAAEAYGAAEPRLSDAITTITSAITAARNAVLLNEADTLRRRLAEHALEADTLNAKLRGLTEWSKKHADQSIRSQLLQPLRSADERKAVHRQLQEIEAAASQFPDRLLADPNVTLEA